MAESMLARFKKAITLRILGVFIGALIACGFTAVVGIFHPDRLTEVIMEMTTFSLNSFDWIFLLSITLFILFSFFLAFSRLGDIKLGKQHEEPEFGLVSWLAMLFAAGMGAGLLFWGVAEPLHHYMSPPPEQGAMTPQAARWAMVVTNLHWGVHAWGIYATAALVLGYYGFRRGRPMLASSPIEAIFPGLFGRTLGFIADLVAIVAVAFGIAGSLGMGVMQINAGLAEVFGTPADSMTVLMGILAVLILFYMIPITTTLDKGIKLLSNINLVVALLLMAYILFLGPTSFIFSTFTTSLGDYITNLINLSFRLYPYSGETEWTRVWTLTYLIWWIAWAPFVGIFIARISRGRTIREFVLMVILFPTIFSVLWFSVFGGAGLHLELFGEGGLASLVLEDSSQALFSLFSYFPYPMMLAVVAVFLILVFLSTSAASGAYVLGMMSTGGSLDPPRTLKLFWGAVVAALTAAVLFAGGGVQVLRAIAISGALPFIVIMIAQVACLLTSLAEEAGIIREEIPSPEEIADEEVVS
ncbi:MAG: BCCT family transporter [Desulfurivibrionaceae bacterium]